ncbi:glycosyltransferase [Vibrio lentus]|uniref:glycosyltransferase n=1 Tax=Vibrio lentus TaxID=136468 RepID=UPI000C837AA3|nr:glycosyltransferase [Vibrio lentus]PMI94470.1 hypothetical protein BCU33_17935 [Vibrio lentus]
MSKAVLNFVDMKFDKSGHYIDDLKEFGFLSKDYICNYYAPIDLDKDDVNVDSKFVINALPKGWKLYFVIYYLLLTKRNEKIFFLSCSFIPLFILSILSINFNYIFRVHSMPVVKVAVYKKVIRYISNLSINTVFLDEPVKEYFVLKGYSHPKKSACVIGRTLDIEREINTKQERSFNLLFIGAMNSEKDLKPIIDALLDQKIEKLTLSFLSKGIDCYDAELNDLKSLYEDLIISNEFLSRSDYDSAIKNADALILPYKVSYGVRFSAVLNDALSLGKKVLTIKLPQFEHYAKRYNACYLYNDKFDVVNAINELMSSPPLNKEDLNLDYSQSVKVAQLKRLGL